MFETLSNLLGAIKNLFGFAQQRDAEKNTAQMQQNAAAQTREEIRQDATKTVADGDLDQLRKDVADQ